jgi:hypothetical protein
VAIPPTTNTCVSAAIPAGPSGAAVPTVTTLASLASIATIFTSWRLLGHLLLRKGRRLRRVSPLGFEPRGASFVHLCGSFVDRCGGWNQTKFLGSLRHRARRARALGGGEEGELNTRKPAPRAHQRHDHSHGPPRPHPSQWQCRPPTTGHCRLHATTPPQHHDRVCASSRADD